MDWNSYNGIAEIISWFDSTLIVKNCYKSFVAFLLLFLFNLPEPKHRYLETELDFLLHMKPFIE